MRRHFQDRKRTGPTVTTLLILLCGEDHRYRNKNLQKAKRKCKQGNNDKTICIQNARAS